MFKQNTFDKYKKNIFITISISITLFLSASVYLYNTYSNTILANIFIVSSFFLTVTLAITILKIIYDKKILSELVSFKDNTKSLYQSSDISKTFEILYNVIQGLPSVDAVNLYYCLEPLSENASFVLKSNTDNPLCSISQKDCMLLKKENCQCPNNPNGYICFCVLNSSKAQSILNISFKKNLFFKKLTLFKVQSYIDTARIVINNNITFQGLNKTASTDKLTKLYNRNFLDSYLEKQIEISNLTRQQLSLIIIDIDNFKFINDTYGHLIGDQVLSIFSQILLKSVRKADIVSRYGGDEFIAVLPSSDTKTARIIAERIRTEVSSTQIQTDDDINIPLISCSIGISTFPSKCDSKSSLIKTSDVALYKAKKAGRNCVKVYER